MILATSRNGDQLIMLQTGDAPSLIVGYEHLPLLFSCVVACYHKQVIFVYNPRRKEWELPAGLIEQGESPDITAKRELHEESNQIADKLAFLGMILLYLPHRQQYELGALYRCDVNELRPFLANDESNQMMLWDKNTITSDYVNDIAIKLIEFANCL